MDRAAARAAVELGIDSLQDRAEIVRETMGHRHEPRFPPGLERGGGENEVSAMFHSSEPTRDILVKAPKPERVMGRRHERELETFLEELPPRSSENAIFDPSTDTLFKEPKPERVMGGHHERELETFLEELPPRSSENPIFDPSTDAFFKEPKPERVTGGQDERDLEVFLGTLQLQEVEVAAARRPVLLKKASCELEPGLYTMTNVRWGMSLENQQVSAALGL